MLLLFETASGFALFKVLDENKLTKVDDLANADINSLVQLQGFHKFENTAAALEACSALVESRMSKPLRHFLKKTIVEKDISEELAVSDAKVGSLIKEKLGITCTSGGAAIPELMRCIRAKLPELLSSATPVDLATTQLGLAHSFSRYKLKFSPEKVDTMIVQAVSLLDDLDKEINTYSMRVREWYGWHFPEMGKVVPDNLVYCKVVQRLKTRNTALKVDLSDLVPEEMEKELKELSQVSMGTEVSDEDMLNICVLCQQVIDITTYREQLWDYLKSRMQAIAPNLSTLVGELVGARLIAHTGSLISLAKYPASTIQILGAEKALFRALKTKKKTPKYGLIYHASLIGQAPTKGKGQISRVLAAKAALCARVDALAEATVAEEALATAEGEQAQPTISTVVGTQGRSTVEMRIRRLESGAQRAAVGGPKRTGGTPQRYDHRMSGGMQRTAPAFDTQMDATLGESKKHKMIEEVPEAAPQLKKTKKEEPEDE